MKIIFIALLSLPFFATAQSFKPDSITINRNPGRAAYLLDTTVDCPYSKAQLYTNTLSYIRNPNKRDPRVIGMDDQASGYVSFVGYISKQIIASDNGNKKGSLQLVRLYYKASILLKDQQFSIVLSMLDYQATVVDRSAFLSGSIKFPKTKNAVDPSQITSEQNLAAEDLSRWLIKNLAMQLNTSPGN